MNAQSWSSSTGIAKTMPTTAGEARSAHAIEPCLKPTIGDEARGGGRRAWGSRLSLARNRRVD